MTDPGQDAPRGGTWRRDNVPLLVSLYTDATPPLTREMGQISRDYGTPPQPPLVPPHPIPLTGNRPRAGSGYRALNQGVSGASDIATSVLSLAAVLASRSQEAGARPGCCSSREGRLVWC
jgi:hypothetical protein